MLTTATRMQSTIFLFVCVYQTVTTQYTDSIHNTVVPIAFIIHVHAPMGAIKSQEDVARYFCFKVHNQDVIPHVYDWGFIYVWIWGIYSYAD